MANVGTIKEAFQVGAAIAIGLFVCTYVIMIQSADSLTETVDIFSRAIVVVLYVVVPTSEIGAVVSITAGAIGAAISLDSVGPRPIALIVAFGFLYTLTNIIINWFTVPV